jgi:hypothetical protein
VARTRIAVALAAIALGGCGGDDHAGAEDDATTPRTAPAAVTLDTRRVEQAIEHSIAAERDVEADVVCPASVKQSRGLTFRCLATSSAGRTTFVVHQVDSRGNVTYAAP